MSECYKSLRGVKRIVHPPEINTSGKKGNLVRVLSVILQSALQELDRLDAKLGT
jgi:hypothetical protein